jgi:NAD(P)-dependent dehydrogenase (short-subunit alcohol dehydrogenase family)
MSKWTLVTGGAKRLGAEICRSLAKEGHNILVHYNKSHTEALGVVKDCKNFGVEAECIQGDFSTQETTQQFILEVLKKDIENLVNNVGEYLVQPPSLTPIDAWSNLYQINFLAPVALIQALIPMLKHHQGSVVNIGVSGLEPMRANTTFTAYLSTKSSLLLATKSLAKEFSPFGIRINMVSPGILDNSKDLPKTPHGIPMGRFGTSQDVARVVAFLFKKENDYITGQNIEVAGGLGL